MKINILLIKSGQKKIQNYLQPTPREMWTNFQFKIIHTNQGTTNKLKNRYPGESSRPTHCFEKGLQKPESVPGLYFVPKYNIRGLGRIREQFKVNSVLQYS